jgi:hypothetical protein
MPLKHPIVPPVFTPQAESNPTLKEVNVPAGGVETATALVLSPQQTMVPLGFSTPHTAMELALTEENVPAGGVNSPKLLSPQQAMVPSVLTPQAYSPPSLTEANVPVGGTASPSRSEPQQSMVPSVITPQTSSEEPTLTDV